MSDVLAKFLEFYDPQWLCDLRSIALGIDALCGLAGWVAADGLVALVADEAHSGVAAGDPLGVADPMASTITPFIWIPQEASATYNYSCVAYGGGGVASIGNPAAVVITDGAAEAPSLLPAPPSELAATPAAGGRFLLTWRYSGSKRRARPVSFNIYDDEASPGTVDYETVVATAPAKTFRSGAGEYSWRSGAFAHATEVEWAVRAEAAGDLEEANTVTATATADAQGPAAIVISTVTYGDDA